MAASEETVLVKLGGSVVTRKDRPETVDRDALADAAGALAGFDGRLVVVHGGGSFGHHHANRHGLTRETGTTDAAAVCDVHGAMVELDGFVVDALRDEGVPAVPVHPLSAASRDAGGDLCMPSVHVERLLGEGFVPVTHGDVVAQEGSGATVLSGDELVVELASAVNADRVGVCSTVPGVLDADGTVIDRIESFEDVADVLEGSDATDVTGGMSGKVRALLALDTPVQVFGPDGIPAFVAGESPGTTVEG